MKAREATELEPGMVTATNRPEERNERAELNRVGDERRLPPAYDFKV